MNKNDISEFKKWVDAAIEFLNAVSKFLGNAVAAIFIRKR